MSTDLPADIEKPDLAESDNDKNEVSDKQENKKSPFTFLGFKGMLGVAAAMISFGQFNDTQELLTGLYENITTHFTHKIQYEQLNVLAIGRTIGYVEKHFGPPEVIKVSSNVDNIVYQYYNIEKAIVCVMNFKERVAGFVVVPIVDDFRPDIRYSKVDLGSDSFANLNKEVSGVFFDANNLVYYSEAVDLGKEYMFLQQVTGFVEYGKLVSLSEELADSESNPVAKIEEINSLFVSDETLVLDEKIADFRENHSANYFGYTELDASLVLESLLTRFEFKSYFGNENES